MTDQRDLDRLLGAFLAEGTDELADRVLNAALEEIDKTPQRQPARVPWRFSTMNTFARVAAAAVLALVAVGATLYLVGLRQPPAVGSSPTPSASAPVASPTSSAVPSVAREFAYIVGDSRTGQQLWIANMDGTGAHELIPGLAQELNPGLGGNPQAPAWSSDGTRLVFTWAPSVGDDPVLGPMFGAARFYLTDASGKAPQLVDTGCVAPCVGDTDPAFSRDGTHLVFVRTKLVPPESSSPEPGSGKVNSDRDASYLATIDLASGRVTELPSTTVLDCPLFPGQHAPLIGNCGGFADHDPRWSPDGTQIVFTQDVPYDINGPASRDINGMPPPRPFPGASLFVVDADGQNLHQISPDVVKDTCCRSADWSPDGTQIVFERTTPPAPILNPGKGTGYTVVFIADVYTVRPDGTDLVRVTSDANSMDPSWSADGRIFVSSATGLWIMDADGSNATQLSPPPLLMAHWPISAPAAAMTADNLNP
jgi:Tol biopolymer transport system component